jgi:hypothetical protein
MFSKDFNQDSTEAVTSVRGVGKKPEVRNLIPDSLDLFMSEYITQKT